MIDAFINNNGHNKRCLWMKPKKLLKRQQGENNGRERL